MNDFKFESEEDIDTIVDELYNDHVELFNVGKSSIKTILKNKFFKKLPPLDIIGWNDYDEVYIPSYLVGSVVLLRNKAFLTLSGMKNFCSYTPDFKIGHISYDTDGVAKVFSNGELLIDAVDWQFKLLRAND